VEEGVLDLVVDIIEVLLKEVITELQSTVFQEISVGKI